MGMGEERGNAAGPQTGPAKAVCHRRGPARSRSERGTRKTGRHHRQADRRAPSPWSLRRRATPPGSLAVVVWWQGLARRGLARRGLDDGWTMPGLRRCGAVAVPTPQKHSPVARLRPGVGLKLAQTAHWGELREHHIFASVLVL